MTNVTVTGVEVAGDCRNAKVYVSVRGDEKTQSLSLHGLRSARGFLQSCVADRLVTRFTPILEFELDQGIKQSFDTKELLRETLDDEPPTATDFEANQ